MKHAMVVAGIVLIVGNAAAQTPKGTTGDPAAAAPGASAALIDTEGRPIGEARFQQTRRGVLVKLDLRNATPGVHAVHIHQVGKCDRPSFESAGGHFSPIERKHGFMNAAGPHAGDMPNVHVPQETRQVSAEFLMADVTLEPGTRSMLDGDGSAIVIHAGPDDYTTDPSGNSGDRIGCGRVEKGK
jgi:Cu-Zn family superoxide dismutase